MPPPPDLNTIAFDTIDAVIAAQSTPPVERWHPEHCGDSEMRIDRDGTWYHQGSPIGRPDMVRKFATILRREPDGGYVLVTPGEKLDIAVEDAPFLATRMRAEDGRIAFQINTGEIVVAGPDHPLRFAQAEDGPRPYLRVRGGLDALIARALYYELAELALSDAGDPPGVSSDGVFFPMMP